MGRLSGIVSALAWLFGAEEEWFRENSPESGPNPRFDPSLGELLLHVQALDRRMVSRSSEVAQSTTSAQHITSLGRLAVRRSRALGADVVFRSSAAPPPNAQVGTFRG